MAGKQAKILTDAQLSRVLAYVETTRHAERNRVFVLLSVKAGLRAGEIAQLTWDMVIDATGQIAPSIELHDAIAKKGSGRRIPLHADLIDALRVWRRQCPAEGPIALSERGDAMTPVSVVNWFKSTYDTLGLKGCTSHSGRRTFITRAARLVHKAGGSLRDVQLLAGHSSIQTTQRYIDGDSDAQRKLVSLI